MTKFEKYFYQYINRYRRMIQISALVFLFMIPVLNLLGYRQIIGTYYSLNLGNLEIVDPALMVQYILLIKDIYFPILLAGIIPLIVALFFGKIFCSWLCPFNLFAEWADRIRKKVRPSSNRRTNKNPRTQLYWFVYGAILLLVAISGLPIIALISMPGLISAQVADLILAGGIGIELGMVPLILGVEIFYKERSWCRYICPVGATLGTLRFRHSLTVKYEPNKCHFQCSGDDKISLCNQVCPIQLNPKGMNLYPYCFNCGACIQACETTGGQALHFTFHPEGTPMGSPIKKTP
jgi:ferredoxin-type protein NapH